MARATMPREARELRHRQRMCARARRKDERRMRNERVLAAHPRLLRLYESPSERAVMFSRASLCLDIAYALAYGAFGMVLSSAWNGTVAAFYIALVLMRLFVLSAHGTKRRCDCPAESTMRGWRMYRRVGVSLMCLVVVFAGALVLLVKNEAHVAYPGYVVYAVAAYTFYQVVYATWQFRRTRKSGDAVLAAIRSIGVVNMLLSLLVLQTALITAFGEPGGQFATVMGGLTSAIMCVLISAIGICMLVRAWRELRAAA